MQPFQAAMQVVYLYKHLLYFLCQVCSLVKKVVPASGSDNSVGNILTQLTCECPLRNQSSLTFKHSYFVTFQQTDMYAKISLFQSKICPTKAYTLVHYSLRLSNTISSFFFTIEILFCFHQIVICQLFVMVLVL